MYIYIYIYVYIYTNKGWKVPMMTSYLLLITFWPIGSKYWNTDRRSVYITRGTLLTNKPILVTFQESIIFNQWTFPTTVMCIYIYIYIYIILYIYIYIYILTLTLTPTHTNAYIPARIYRFKFEVFSTGTYSSPCLGILSMKNFSMFNWDKTVSHKQAQQSCLLRASAVAVQTRQEWQILR